MSARLTKIEASVIGDHPHLGGDDECYFMLEYTSGQNYEFSKTNQLISNLKKPVTFMARPSVWKHKTRAIEACSRHLGEALNGNWLKQATLIPIPPSKVKADPEHDSRMLTMLQGMNVGYSVDIREILYQTHSTRQSHLGGNRLTVDELKAVYRIDETLCTPAPKVIGLVDDVLTAGTHFRAAKDILSARFPGVEIYGLFVARRIFLT